MYETVVHIYVEGNHNLYSISCIDVNYRCY